LIFKGDGGENETSNGKGRDKVKIIKCIVKIKKPIEMQKKIEWMKYGETGKDNNIKDEWLWIFI